MVKRDLFKHLLALLLVVLAVVGLSRWLYESVTIDQQMTNQYLHKGDHILVNMHKTVKEGDFVLYKVEGKRYVGRIVATEGNSVRYMDNILYVNDLYKREVYLPVESQTDDFTISDLTRKQSSVVTKGHYLILNDNRNDRRDSREFGLIDQSQIIGKLTFRYRPLNKFGFVETGVTD